MLNKSIFAERLSMLMSNHKLSKQSLANSIGISRPSVSQLAHGENLPSLETLVLIAQYFNVSVDYLLGLTDNKETNK